MGKKRKKQPPVPTERDLRSRERAGERGATPEPEAPDGVSGDWS